ncbi:exported hypothetical protein [Candidatus Sulfotelmatomonas gaucii]|uniref:Uncharacterized protein n=1 Tax=Candidatus Sulfuritelmatomonas gaucii TaxID=2043161 RepID=A0A2N9L3Z5_9BACT|nr:exported hypothetical protein [Candidatus Sulfotelmatomonas gaucii]
MLRANPTRPAPSEISMQSPATALSRRNGVARLAFLASCCSLLLPAVSAASPPDGIHVQGSGTPPQLAFGCCDQGIAPMQALFADHEVIAALHDMHAQVGVAVADFSPERVQVVRYLNQQQIPVIAGVTLQTKDGPYFNVDNVAEAPAQIAAFEKWTRDNGLRWDAVGIDIEPNFSQLAELRNHRWRLVTTLLRNSLDGKRIQRAQEAYSALIRQIQLQGYPVETYTLPYGPVERNLRTTLIDRLLGTVDVSANENDVMIDTSYARPVGSAIILGLGPYSQGILVGVTDGLTPAGSGFGPLDWDEFSNDLIVASHFAHHIGVYNLEGCVRHGYLPRLETMNWGESVVIPAASVARARQHVMAFSIALWIASRLPFLAAAVILPAAFCIWWWRRRRLRLRHC